tara:strand:- start:91 stop:630 length:540 start_codon:yes stop_codon:yes gene_type:complete
MPINYRRTALDRDTTFYQPKVECFACYDSGIVSNGDKLINKYIPDYDRDQKGRPCGGQDLAIICHCKAAYEDEENQKVGFRDSLGNIKTTDSIRGEPQAIGVSLEKDKIRHIHTERKACWENTAMVQNLIRNKIAKGEKYETPYYIEVVKEELSKVGDMFSFPSEKAIVKSMKKNNDKN